MPFRRLEPSRAGFALMVVQCVPERLLRDALKAYVNVVRQRDLATLFGVSQPLLSLWLNGRRNSAAVKALQRKLQHWIFYGPGAMPVVPPPPSPQTPSARVAQI